MRDRERPVCLNDPEGDEEARDRRTAMNAAQGVHDALDRWQLVNLLQRDRLSHDEAGDEVALRPDERDHLRAYTYPGRGDRCGMLNLAADPEKMGVVAAEPDHVPIVPVARG